MHCCRAYAPLSLASCCLLLQGSDLVPSCGPSDPVRVGLPAIIAIQINLNPNRRHWPQYHGFGWSRRAVVHTVDRGADLTPTAAAAQITQEIQMGTLSPLNEVNGYQRPSQPRNSPPAGRACFWELETCQVFIYGIGQGFTLYCT